MVSRMPLARSAAGGYDFIGALLMAMVVHDFADHVHFNEAVCVCADMGTGDEGKSEWGRKWRMESPLGICGGRPGRGVLRRSFRDD